MPPQVARRAKRSEDVLRGTDQQAPPECIARFGDAQLRLRFTTVIQARHQAEVGTDIATLGEAGGILDQEHIRQRGDGTYARGLLQALGDGITLPDHLRELPILLLDAPRKLRDQLEQRAHRGLQDRGDLIGRARRKRLG